MNQHKHLLAFDLTSYGVGFAIINQFVDDESIKVFEISPSGASAVLILLGKESVSLQIVKSEVQAYFKGQILSSTLIENIHEELLLTYLSQNKPKLQNVVMILEGSYVSNGLQLADAALKNGNILVDFRVIRTFPKNVVLTLTGAETKNFIQIEDSGFKKTLIENVQPVLKSYFEL